MRIHVAEEKHIPVLTSFGMHVFKNELGPLNVLNRFQPDESLLHDRIGECVRNGYCFVAVDNKKLVGSIGGMIEEPLWWSKETALCDVWYAVHPKHRKSRIAVSLIQQMEEVADVEGVPYVSGYCTGGNTSRKEAMWNWRNYSKFGSSFVRT